MEDSIISTRQRRSNAGSRIKELMGTSEPLEDEFDIFAEVEGDDEFELSDSDSEPETPEQDESDQAEPEIEIEQQVQDEAPASGADSNFSSESEPSSSEEDNDSGEKELKKAAREAAREARRAEREKLFLVKERSHNPSKKRKAAPRVETLLAQDRRVSKRASSVRNRDEVIERLRETERRRQEYVVPARPKRVKLTQAQRLAEAQLTEQKNVASLNRFVELEELRKQQRRLTMMMRRPKLVEFVRWSSKSLLEYPVEAEPDAPQAQTQTQTQAQTPTPTPTPNTSTAAQAEKEMEPKDQPTQPDQPGLNQPKESESTESKIESTESKSESEPDQPKSESPEPDQPEQPKSDQPESQGNQPETDMDVKTEKEETLERDVQGPPLISNYSMLTLHEFHEPQNRQFVRTTILGAAALKAAAPPPKKLCPITGNVARYLDPESRVAYHSRDTLDLLKCIKNHEWAWSSALGGLYSQPFSGLRHAQGVPEGFA